MKVTRHEAPPVVVPKPMYTLELSEEEAQHLAGILARTAAAPPAYHMFDALTEALDEVDVDVVPYVVSGRMLQQLNL